MGRIKAHKDVEYAVNDGGGNQRIFKTFDEAAGFAVSLAYAGDATHIDVLVYSEAGAKFMGSDDGVETYREDPDASVFQRLEIKVDDLGRIA